MRYLVKWTYRSGFAGPWREGDIVDIRDDLAERVNRDSPGVLELVEDAPRIVTKKSDRQQRGGTKRAKD